MTEKECAQFSERFVRPFHLSRGPLFDFAVIKTESAVKLFADFHHLVFDGFSMDLFLKELGTLLKDESAEPEGEGASYFAYIKNQKQMLTGEQRSEYESYFASLLDEFESPTELPGDVSAAGGAGKKCFVYRSIDEAAVSKACSQPDVSEPGFFLAALDYTLSRLTASERVYISTISSGRSDTRFADTFGMFVNTLPLASKLSDASVQDYIREVSEGLDEAVSHENYPFSEVASGWGFSSNIMYEYQRGVVEKPDIPGLIKIEGLESGQAKFGITIRITDRDAKPVIEAEYNDAAYSQKGIEEFLTSYSIAIEKFAKNGRDKVRSISLLNDEREALLRTYHARKAEVSIPSDVLFHSGIERWASEQPDRPALTASDGDYTYKELDEEANRVANALIALGVGKGSRVVLLLPRTAKVFFAIYGVLKAGGAYIPCDPNYPVERVRHIIDDSGAELIVTTQDRLDRFESLPRISRRMTWRT